MCRKIRCDEESVKFYELKKGLNKPSAAEAPSCGVTWPCMGAPPIKAAVGEFNSSVGRPGRSTQRTDVLVSFINAGEARGDDTAAVCAGPHVGGVARSTCYCRRWNL